MNTTEIYIENSVEAYFRKKDDIIRELVNKYIGVNIDDLSMTEIAELRKRINIVQNNNDELCEHIIIDGKHICTIKNKGVSFDGNKIITNIEYVMV